jgi:hypothetical protein
MAEFVCPFIRREPWWIGGDFEKRSRGLAVFYCHRDVMESSHLFGY